MEYKRGAEAPPVEVRQLRLELHAYRELELPRVCRSIDARAVGDGSGVLDVSAWSAPVDVVEDIERIHAELERCDLPYREVLLHREVRIEEMRPKDAISPNGSNLIQTRGGKSRPHPLRIAAHQIPSQQTAT